jgi:hypothetical protein
MTSSHLFNSLAVVNERFPKSTDLAWMNCQDPTFGGGLARLLCHVASGSHSLRLHFSMVDVPVVRGSLSVVWCCFGLVHAFSMAEAVAS